jgi:hypothetical protein
LESLRIDGFRRLNFGKLSDELVNDADRRLKRKFRFSLRMIASQNESLSPGVNESMMALMELSGTSIGPGTTTFGLPGPIKI